MRTEVEMVIAERIRALEERKAVAGSGVARPTLQRSQQSIDTILYEIGVQTLHERL